MARRDSLDRDQGRSRRPGGASSRLLPFEVLPVASTVITGAVASNRLAGRAHVAVADAVGRIRGRFDLPGAPGGSGRLHREIGQSERSPTRRLTSLAWARWPQRWRSS